MGPKKHLIYVHPCKDSGSRSLESKAHIVWSNSCKTQVLQVTRRHFHGDVVLSAWWSSGLQTRCPSGCETHPKNSLGAEICYLLPSAHPVPNGHFLRSHSTSHTPTTLSFTHLREAGVLYLQAQHQSWIHLHGEDNSVHAKTTGFQPMFVQ